MDSMTAKLNTLRASMQDFWNSILNTGTINAGIDALNSLLQVLDGLAKAFKSVGDATGTGMLPTILGTGLSGIIGNALVTNIKNAKEASGKSGLFAGFGEGIRQTGKDILSLGLKGDSGYDSYWQAFKDGAKNANGEIANLTAGLKNVWANMTGVSKAVLKFSAAAVAIGLAVKMFDHFTTSAQEAQKAVETANESYKKQIASQKEMRDTIDKIGPEWQKLSAGVDSNGNNISLTNDEFERYHELCNQIAGIMPNVVSGYDEQGNAILDLTGKMSDLNAEYDKLVQKQAYERFNDNFDAYSEDYKNKNGGMINTDEGFWGILKGVGNSIKTYLQGGSFSDVAGKDSIIGILKKLQDMDYKDARVYFNDNGQYDSAVADEINKLLGTSTKTTEEEFNNLKANGNIKAAIESLQQEFNESANNVKQSMQDYITSITTGDGKFSNLDDNVISAATQALQNSSNDALKTLSENKAKMAAEINNWFDVLENNPGAQTALTNLIGINDDTSIEDIKKMYEEDFKTLSEALNLDENGVSELKIKLNLDGTEDLIKQYNNIITQAQAKANEEGKAQISGIVKDYSEQLRNIDITKPRGNISGKRMNEAGWNNIKKSDFDSYYAQALEAEGKQFVLTPVTPDGETILSPSDLDNYLHNEILQGTDSKNLLLGEFDSKDAAKKVKSFTKEFTKASKKFNQSNKNIKDFLNRNNINTKQEMNLLKSLMDKYDNWSDVMKNWSADSFDVNVNADSLEALDANLDKVKETIENVDKAYSESITSSGMTKEAIQNVVDAFSDLDGYDYNKLFESTASGVHLNTTELAKMNAEYEKHEKSKYTDKLKEETTAYENICRQITEANTLSEKQELIRKRDDITKQIQQTQELLSRYEGLTNAVTKYQQALQNGEEGDTYDSIVSGYENAKKLWDQGLVGTNEFKSFTQMFSADDLTGKPIEDYVAAWQIAVPKMDRWLSEGGDGVENFLNDIRALNSEWAKVDGKGNWDLKGLPDMETLANSLGISQSMIDQMMRKLNDYGFTINFTEEADNLRYLANEAREANKAIGGFGDLKLDDSALTKVTEDAEMLQQMKDFKFNLDLEDPDALDDQIKIAENLKQALVNAYGTGSEKVEQFDKQLDYIKAKRGELTNVSDLANKGFGIGYDMEADADKLDEIIIRLTKIKNFSQISLNLNAGNIEDINKDLATLEGKIKTLQGKDGKVDLSKDGAIELLELYSSELSQQSKLSDNKVISEANTDSIKVAAQRDAITYLQTYQKVASEYKNAQKVNDKFGEGTINIDPLAEKVKDAFSKITNAGNGVKEAFKNIGIDISNINLDDLNNSMNWFAGQLNDVSETDLSNIGGSLTSSVKQLDEFKKKAEEAKETLGDKSLNIDVNGKSNIESEITRGENLKQVLANDEEAVKSLNQQIDYLNQKKELYSGGGLNTNLNYTDNKASIDEIVTKLQSIDKYKDIKINIDTNNITDIDASIGSVVGELKKLKDPKTGEIDFTQEGAAELMDTLTALVNKEIEIKNNSRVYMNVDTSGMDENYQNAMNNIHNLQDAIDELDKQNKDKSLNPNIDTSQAEKAVAEAWKTIQNDADNEKIYSDLNIDPKKVNIEGDKISRDVEDQIQDQLDGIDCEVMVKAGYDVKNIDKIKEDLKFLKDKYNVDIDIDWKSKSPEYISGKIEELKEKLKELRGEDGLVKIGEEGYDQAREAMLSLIRMKQEAEGNVVLSIDTSQLEGETKNAVTDLQEVMRAYQNLQTLKDLQTAGIEVDTSEIDAAQGKVNQLVSEMANNHPEMAASVGLTVKEGDEAKIVSDVNNALSGINASMLVKAGVDSSLVDGYTPEDKDATVTYNVNRQAVDNFLAADLTKSGTVKWYNDTSSVRTSFKASGSVVQQANGTAHANGTAYTGGKWGLDKDETALVGELGSELVVNPSDGTWNLVGEHGAEFAGLKKGQIVFNHKQTEELLKNGYVTSNGGRGRALVNGTINKLNSLFRIRGSAYAQGSYGGSGGSFGHFYKNKNFYSNAKSNVSHGSKNDKAKDDFKETVDWIEIMIQRLEDEISNLDTIASSVYKNFSKRNKALGDEFSDVTKEISLQQKAYDAYMEKANSIGLSADYMDKIKNGRLQIEDITDENLKSRIDEAQSWIDKAYDAKNSIESLNETLGDLVNQNFENVQKEFEYTINEIEHETSLLENQLNIIENKGMFAGQAYYESLMKNEQQKIDQLAAQYNAMEKAMNEALDSGAVEKDSEALKEMESALNDVEEAWAEAHNQMLEYQNDMREMKWSIFEKAIDYISDIKDESEFIQNLLSVNENDLFVKKTGRLSDAGMASGALHAQNYDVNMGLAESYRKQIEELDKEIAKDPTNTILIDKKLEYVQAQRESINAANEEKKNIQQLVSDSYDKMLDVLQKLIDKRKEALEAEKD